jgi:hypothetical protein
VNSSFSASRRSPLEVFHHIRDINFGSVDACFFQSTVQELSRWTNEWMPGAIFLISGLLSDQHDVGRGRTFPEYGLSSQLPQIACLATACILAQSCERAV